MIFNAERSFEKVGGIPLGIEFIIGQLARKKSLGQIYEELEGYPDVNEATTGEEKRRLLSEIILFSFRDMFETLDKDHHMVFKIVAASKLRGKKGEDIRFENLMAHTSLSDLQLTDVIDSLIENKLIYRTPENRYSINQMSLNFARRYYPDFGAVLNEYVKNQDKIKGSDKDDIDLSIQKAQEYRNNSEYDEALKILRNRNSYKEDYRLYLELGKTQVSIHKDSQASDSFKRAANPT